ncbi:O-methyltransferase ZRP4 [Dichanthelium oligosanthes]|uniref:O-methyltransferase ZRP4 n=1 Tax=Dichanthelium oligosanthes TaxID=888268 RepID=A0A1E5UWR2_9POAL|nr:O-methyltransferase ZRP4 [Dichanthelium oligosanthes]
MASLLDAQLELWHNTFAYVKSMALKTAMDLQIADAIHDHGNAATLPQIVSKVRLHPSKIPCLRRLLRVLTVTGIFTVQNPPPDGGELVYGLTPASQLLVGSAAPNLTPFLTLVLRSNVFMSPFLGLGTWFQHELLPDTSLIEMTHGQSLWDMADHNPAFAAVFNEGMVSDSRFIMDIVIKEYGHVFQGISSLMDVAGGLGEAAQAISKAFPHVKCSVLDLSHVVTKAPAGTNVNYITGNMFEYVAPANAVFLKWVLHDWGDDDCVKILKNCKKAIPPRDAGGKVIILDIVIGAGPSDLKHKETQVLFDLFIMCVNGIERDEQEWKKIIFDAGFNDYKIIPVLGVRSIIEAYP